MSKPKTLKPKKCKSCGIEFIPKNSLQKVCSPKCALDLTRQNAQKAQERAEKKKQRERKAKLKSRSEWLKEAQAVFNKFIRLRDKNEPCISCGRYHQGQYHAGHYRSVGACPELRFCELNVHKQCAPCNDHKICQTNEVTTDVNTEVKKDKPITRSIIAPEADIVRVTITVPGLSHQNKSNGDINGTKVELKVEYQANGSQWIDAGNIVIEGKTTSSYNREHSFRLTGEAPWNIKVTRLTDDSDSQVLQNKTIFSKITTVFEEKLTYPGVAYVGVQIDAEQFSSIPSRGYHCRGIKLKVPSNYNPETREYSGDWDGTFIVKYSNNPVWIYFDLLTNEEYGAGEYIKEDMLDKWSMYQIAKYCDELVPDGFGGREPRFTCNVYIQTKQEAFKLLRDLTSVFRAMSYWSSGTQMLVQDSPKDPIYQFNNTNVIGGKFSRAGSNIKTRHNVVLVTWNDPKKYFKQSVEYIEDPEAIVKMGYISQTEVVAFGCTSRGQARRLGKWLLYTEQYESEVITFSCGQDGAIPIPGEVI